jgi:hypothetical protein
MLIDIDDSLISDLKIHASKLNTNLETLVSLLLQDYMYFNEPACWAIKVFPPITENKIQTIKFVRMAADVFLIPTLQGLKVAKDYVEAIPSYGCILFETQDYDSLHTFCISFGRDVSYEVITKGYQPFKLPRLEVQATDDPRRIRIKKRKILI